MQYTILVVEDEAPIADLIEVYLKNENFRVLKAQNGSDALACAESEKIDLAMLDLMLPDMSGLEICHRFREKYTFPIIILTSKDEETDKITGLTMGADDYMTKPFRPLELIARVKAQLRRYTKYNAQDTKGEEHIITIGGLTINAETHECHLDEKPIVLTPREFDILWTLCAERGKVISSEDLFHAVWGEKYYEGGNNTVMVHIRHIREKMGDNAENPKYIKTVWGVGYKIER